MRPETTKTDNLTDDTTNDMVYGTTVIDHLLSTSTPMTYYETTRYQQENSKFIEIESNSTNTTFFLSTTSECKLFSDFETFTISFENLPFSVHELRKFKNTYDKTELCVSFPSLKMTIKLKEYFELCLGLGSS